MKHLSGVGLTVLAASFVGCTTPTATATPEQRAIINGVRSEADDDAAVGIGLFNDQGGFAGACSGVLIADNLVLTARHCVSQVENSGIACQSDGTPVVGGGVVSDYAPENLRILLGSDLVFAFAANGMKLITLPSNNLCDSDLALLVLDRKIPGATIAQIRLDKPPTTDEKIRAVGWGVANKSSEYIRRKRDDIPILLVGPDDGAGLGAHELMIGEGICSGDSGGPAFVESTKAVIGVVSRGGNGRPYDPQKDPQYTECVDSGQYVTQNTYTRTDSYKDFILTGFAAAGAEPWLEGGPDPRKAKFGEAWGSDVDCRSGLCLTGTKAPMCSTACDAQTKCEAGFVCQTVNGRKACEIKHKSGCSAAPGLVESAPSIALLLGALAIARRRLRRRA